MNPEHTKITIEHIKNKTKKLSNIISSLDSMESSLSRRFSNIAIYNLSKKISALAARKQDFSEYVDTTKGVLRENGIEVSFLKRNILSGNDIGTLSELYKATEAIDADHMYHSVIKDGENSEYLTATHIGTAESYLATAILKFSDILKDTREVESTISSLYGDDEKASISEHINFVTKQGLTSIDNKTLGVSKEDSVLNIENKVIKIFKDAEAKIKLAKEQKKDDLFQLTIPSLVDKVEVNKHDETFSSVKR